MTDPRAINEQKENCSPPGDRHELSRVSKNGKEVTDKVRRHRTLKRRWRLRDPAGVGKKRFDATNRGLGGLRASEKTRRD